MSEEEVTALNEDGGSKKMVINLSETNDQSDSTKESQFAVKQ